MPKKFPHEFMRDVFAVARRGTIVVPSGRRLRRLRVDALALDSLGRRQRRDPRRPDHIRGQEIVQLWRDKRRLEMENEILRRAAACFAKDALAK